MAIISGTFFIIGSLLLAVGYDVHSNGQNFEASFTGQKLKQYGGFEYGLVIYEQTALISNKTAVWASENLPVYLNSTSEYLRPYYKLGRDVSIVAYNASKRSLQRGFVVVSESYPVVEQWKVILFAMCLLPARASSVVKSISLINHLKTMLPPRKVQKNLPVVRDAVFSAASTAKDGAFLAVESAKTYCSSSLDYLKTNVFVGKLSPESLQKMTMEAYNTTHVFATNTLSWVYQKVQTLSK